MGPFVPLVTQASRVKLHFATLEGHGRDGREFHSRACFVEKTCVYRMRFRGNQRE